MKNGTLRSPLPMLKAFVGGLRPYAAVGLFLLFALVYGYLVLQINSLSNPTIDFSEVVAEAKGSPSPRIDTQAAEQLQTLKDNSVNVQTLFDQSRKNPFQE
jgi:hypothetical protein